MHFKFCLHSKIRVNFFQKSREQSRDYIRHARAVSILATQRNLQYCCGKRNVRACQRPQSCLYPREFPHVAGNFVPNYSTAPTESFSWSFCYLNKKGQAFGERERLDKRSGRVFVHPRSNF